MKNTILSFCFLAGFCVPELYGQVASQKSGTLKVEKAMTDSCVVLLSLGRSGRSKEIKQEDLASALGVMPKVIDCMHACTTRVVSFEMVTKDRVLKSNSNKLTTSMKYELKQLKTGDSVELQNIFYQMQYRGKEPKIEVIISETFTII